MRRLTRRTLLAGAGVSVLVPSCLSPTLPMPPPDVPDALEVGGGQYRLRGSLPVVARVIVRNVRTTELFGREDVLDYDFNVTAQPSDTLIIWYETGSEISSAVSFILDRVNPILDGGP